MKRHHRRLLVLLADCTMIALPFVLLASFMWAYFDQEEIQTLNRINRDRQYREARP